MDIIAAASVLSPSPEIQTAAASSGHVASQASEIVEVQLYPFAAKKIPI